MAHLVTFKQRGHFPSLVAVQSDGRLSSELAGPGEVDEAVANLKREIDIAARELKLELKKRRPLKLGPIVDAQGS